MTDHDNTCLSAVAEYIDLRQRYEALIARRDDLVFAGADPDDVLIPTDPYEPVCTCGEDRPDPPAAPPICGRLSVHGKHIVTHPDHPDRPRRCPGVTGPLTEMTALLRAVDSFVWRNPQTGKELVLDPHDVAIVWSPPLEDDAAAHPHTTPEPTP